MDDKAYYSSGQLRVRTCSCGCLFDLETAKSHSLYDHSRPELCFACQRSGISIGAGDWVVKQPFLNLNKWIDKE